jgi:hypothetical protein
MSGIACWGSGWVLIPAHGTAVLRCESACDIEIAVLIERYGLRNLAARTIEFHFSAFF